MSNTNVKKWFTLLALGWSDGYSFIPTGFNMLSSADYVLMDTWFTTEPMMKEILKTGIDAIGMVKQLKHRYAIMVSNTAIMFTIYHS